MRIKFDNKNCYDEHHSQTIHGYVGSIPYISFNVAQWDIFEVLKELIVFLSVFVFDRIRAASCSGCNVIG